MGPLDLNRDKVTALVFAHLVWIVAAAIPYVTTPGTELFSFSALALVFGGMLVAGPLFGLALRLGSVVPSEFRRAKLGRE